MQARLDGVYQASPQAVTTVSAMSADVTSVQHCLLTCSGFDSNPASAVNLSMTHICCIVQQEEDCNLRVLACLNFKGLNM